MTAHRIIKILNAKDRQRAIQKQSSSPMIKKPKISHTRKPDDMKLDEWQIALRKEFGRQQNFGIENIGMEPVFSEYVVKNPQTNGEYRVAIRGKKVGDKKSAVCWFHACLF